MRVLIMGVLIAIGPQWLVAAVVTSDEEEVDMLTMVSGSTYHCKLSIEAYKV